VQSFPERGSFGTQSLKANTSGMGATPGYARAPGASCVGGCNRPAEHSARRSPWQTFAQAVIYVSHVCQPKVQCKTRSSQSDFGHSQPNIARAQLRHAAWRRKRCSNGRSATAVLAITRQISPLLVPRKSRYRKRCFKVTTQLRPLQIDSWAWVAPYPKKATVPTTRNTCRKTVPGASKRPDR
jgi:hypothetical protein